MQQHGAIQRPAWPYATKSFFEAPTCCIGRHRVPCGVGRHRAAEGFIGLHTAIRPHGIIGLRVSYGPAGFHKAS